MAGLAIGGTIKYKLPLSVHAGERESHGTKLLATPSALLQNRWEVGDDSTAVSGLPCVPSGG